jgi:hypothetical protein
VLSDHDDIIGQICQHLRAEIPEASVPEDDDAIGPTNRDLSGYLKRRGYGFGEDGHIVADRVRNGMKIALRHSDQIGKCAVVIRDPNRRAPGTVCG